MGMGRSALPLRNRRSKMLPALQRVRNSKLAHAVLFGQRPQRSRRGLSSTARAVLCSNGEDLFGGQFVIPVSFSCCLARLVTLPLRPTIPRYRVLDILRLCPAVEMVDVADAPRRVAGVAAVLSRKQWTDQPLEYPDVRAVGCPVHPEAPVPILVEATTPQPAGLRFLDLAPESWQRIDRRAGSPRVNTSRHVGILPQEGVRR